MKKKRIFSSVLVAIFTTFVLLGGIPTSAATKKISAKAQISIATKYTVVAEKSVKPMSFTVKVAQLSVYAAKAQVKKVTSKTTRNILTKRLNNVQIKINARAKTIATAKQIDLATTYVVSSENIVKVSDFLVKTSQLSVYTAKDQLKKVASYGKIYSANYTSLMKRLANVQIKINARAKAIAEKAVAEKVAEETAEKVAETAVKTAETSRKSADVVAATKAVVEVKNVAKAEAFTARINAINVLAEVTSVSAITVTSEGNATTVVNGGTLKMSAVVTPGDATNKAVTWSVTTGTGIAIVDTTGLLTATASGTVTVVATADNGVKGEATVTVIDKQPAITNVKMVSNNADITKAKNGDIITLTFTSDDAVTKLGNFKINGSNPDTFTSVGNVYTATHLVDAGDKVGQAATFQINVKNAAGIYSLTVEQTTDGSSVTIADEKPVITNVKMVSNNADITKAKNGDIITLTFTSDDAVTKLGNFKINGSNPDTFTNVGNVYTATHLVDAGDTVGQVATFQINVKNAEGIYSLTVEKTTDSSSVTITE